jgi:hypothetical protein
MKEETSIEPSEKAPTRKKRILLPKKPKSEQGLLKRAPYGSLVEDYADVEKSRKVYLKEKQQ